MTNKPSNLTAIGYSLAIVYGVGLIVYLCFFASSFSNPDILMSSSTVSSRFGNIAEFQKDSAILWILISAQLVGLIAVGLQKEWGRRLVIYMSILFCCFLLGRMTFELHRADAGNISTILVYLSVIYFFNWPKVKEQFRNPKGHKRILIIDDDRGLLKLMKVNLASQGYDVLTADTGEKGIEAAKRERPDLIILDVILPGIKGREVCARLKNDARTKDIPVIFLTAKNSPDDIKAELELGATSHITKPLDSSETLNEVRKILHL